MGPVWVGRQINKASDQGTEEGGLDPIKLSLASPRNGWPGSNSCSTLWGPASCGSQTAHKVPRAWVTLRGGGCVATPPPPQGSQEQLPGVRMGALGWDSKML